MRKALLSIPGKTFLAGEYLALVGGPAFVLCTGPRFQLEVLETPSNQSPFHPASPAGKLYSLNADRLSRVTLKWIDPYQGLGGFGASSAQFALLSGMLQLGDELWGESERVFDWHDMLSSYREIAGQDRSTVPPSGADLVGAIGGGITFFERNRGLTQTFSWPFRDLEFFLFHTSEKLATHEHLKSLKIFETQKFYEAISLVLNGLRSSDSQMFVNGIQKYRDELWKQGWATEKSIKSVSTFEKLKSVRVAKGCGAMGSDVILVVGSRGRGSEIKAQGKDLGLVFMAETLDLAKGLQVDDVIEIDSVEGRAGLEGGTA